MKRPRISFVVAVARNGVIGRKGELPWRISSDLKRFKAITMGKPVIMGRKTWESLPQTPVARPAQYRDHARPRLSGGWCRGRDERSMRPWRKARQTGSDEICVIGGSDIFRQMLPKADRLYLTEVDLTPPGDVFFPVIRSGRLAGNVARRSMRVPMAMMRASYCACLTGWLRHRRIE